MLNFKSFKNLKILKIWKEIKKQLQKMLKSSTHLWYFKQTKKVSVKPCLKVETRHHEYTWKKIQKRHISTHIDIF